MAETKDSVVVDDLTTPNYIQVGTSSIPRAGQGAFVTKTLESGFVLGEYKGESLTNTQANERPWDMYMFDIKNPKGELVCVISAHDPLKSNWSRYVNSVEEWNSPLRNVEFFQVDNRLFLRTTRRIEASLERPTELLCWYGPNTKRFLPKVKSELFVRQKMHFVSKIKAYKTQDKLADGWQMVMDICKTTWRSIVPVHVQGKKPLFLPSK